MYEVEQPSLRERKKMRTRETVLREAFRLFETNGYANTTVEQIARAADVSPRTFFRYFPSKESLLVSDRCVEPICTAFKAAPAELSPAAAYRHALMHVFGTMDRDELDFMTARQHLMYTMPDVKGALYDEYIHSMRALAEAVAVRLNRPREDPIVPVVAGAITGVMMATADESPLASDAVLLALDLLDKGLPE
ncbi:TetR family transcriptional regulator [Mycobacterium sp. 236(2023)]|uniref:TetR/AcrR family transcriptional regulator n=1 Tax=Mycobacterium sp. 236(2023) TaxID=3038163 RepID=UPI0024150678|nr:TetR family transcriptional regulator [Mycobacterium sp. 236(2023)]MDG4663140.1 TetR family transcriptional regulator [Mycobacterium sp. 236(2023)]